MSDIKHAIQGTHIGCTWQYQHRLNNRAADEAHLGGLVKDDAGVGDIAVLLVELGEGAPQAVGLADRLLTAPTVL